MSKTGTISIVMADNLLLFRSVVGLVIDANERFSVVGSVKTGWELLKWMEDGGNADIVLLDVELKEISGMDCLIKIKEKYPAQKVVMYSDIDNEQIILQAILSGVNSYLPKSIQTKEFFEAVQIVHQAGFFYTSEVLEIIFRNSFR